MKQRVYFLLELVLSLIMIQLLSEIYIVYRQIHVEFVRFLATYKKKSNQMFPICFGLLNDSQLKLLTQYLNRDFEFNIGDIEDRMRIRN